jgi:hypothetical protein
MICEKHEFSILYAQTALFEVHVFYAGLSKIANNEYSAGMTAGNNKISHFKKLLAQHHRLVCR